MRAEFTLQYALNNESKAIAVKCGNGSPSIANKMKISYVLVKKL